MNEEDIKILKNAIKIDKKQFEELGTHILLGNNEIQAIENLIKGNKDLEEELEMYKDMKDIMNCKIGNARILTSKDVIPTSVIKEKIEEIRKIKMDIVTSPVHNTDEKLEILKRNKIKKEVLEELLEDK